MAASPYGDVLQCLEWGDVKKPDWQPVTVAIQTEGKLDATALVLKRSIPKTGRCIFYVSRGPILDWSRPEIAAALVKQLKEVAKSHKAILIKVDPAVPSGTPGVAETLGKMGFIPSPDANNGFGGTQPRCVMKLDISAPLDDVMAQFHQKWRYNIRVAERKGVTVKSDCTREDLKVFHDLYAVTAQRDGFTGRPLSYFQKLWDALMPGGMGKVFITYYQDKPLSAAFCFVLGAQCWYVYGASSNEHRNVMPNHAMQWAMIKWAKECGCSIYDFRGVADEGSPGAGTSAGAPAASAPAPAAPEATEAPAKIKESSDGDNHLQGLNRFKAGFGAELVDYVGEWDLVLDKKWYWLWTTAKPKLVAALKKRK